MSEVPLYHQNGRHVCVVGVTCYYQHGGHVCTPTKVVSEQDLQGYLAHKKTPPLPTPTIGP